jgi:hypothetical protein
MEMEMREGRDEQTGTLRTVFVPGLDFTISQLRFNCGHILGKACGRIF